MTAKAVRPPVAASARARRNRWIALALVGWIALLALVAIAVRVVRH